MSQGDHVWVIGGPWAGGYGIIVAAGVDYCTVNLGDDVVRIPPRYLEKVGI